MKYDMLSIKPALPSLITLFFAYIGFSITTPVLIDLSLKATNHYFWLTIMMSSYPIGAILGANLIGIMSDYLGRKKTLLVSLLLSAICYALAGVAIYHQSMIWLACIRLLQGSIEGSMVIAQRTIADTIPQKKHSRFFSYLYSFPATAFIIGPNILAYNIMSQNQSNFSYATPFWFQSIIMLGCAWLVQATFADYHQEKSSHNWKEDIKAFIQSIQTNRRLRYVYVTNFFIFIVSTGFLRYYPIYIADHFQANIIVNSITISWVAMGSLITYLCINPLLFKQFKPKQIIVISGSALSLSMLITSQVTTLFSIKILLLIDIILVTIWIPSCLSELSKIIDSQHYGKAFGQNHSIKLIANLLINLTFTQLITIDKQLPLILLSCASLIAAIMVTKERLLQTEPQSSP